MYFLYNILLLILILIYLPILLYKSLRSSNFIEFKEKLGFFTRDFYSNLEGKKVIWLHAASVGETLLAKQIINEISKEYPRYAIILSTITDTGNEIARDSIENLDALIYMPLDSPFFLNRIIKRIKPELLILVETELWPNLIKKADKNAASIIVLNGRISDNSFNKYLKFKPFIKKVLSNIDSFYMQSKLDMDRILALGADEKKVLVSGNIKYDRIIEKEMDKKRLYKALSITEETTVIVAGSTHANEESQLLKVYEKIKNNFPDTIMIIAPRYIERSDEIIGICNSYGIAAQKWTEAINSNSSDKRDVFLVDTFGELAALYQIATLVFVGGSLVSKGGHNILEAAAFGKAVIVGPHMFNFKEDLRYFKEADALIQVSDIDELEEEFMYYLKNKSQAKELGLRAKKLIKKNQGALQKSMQGVNKILHANLKILLVRLSAIGDVIHALPAAYNVREKYPDAEITWLVEEKAAGIVKLNPYIDHVLVMPKCKWSKMFKTHKRKTIKEVFTYLNNLKSYEFDIVIDMHSILKSALPTGMTRAVKRFGSANGKEASTLFYNRKIEVPSNIRHKIDRNLYLLEKALGLSSDKIEFAIIPGVQESKKVDELLKENSLIDKKYIVINPFTTWESKDWPLERYIVLAKRIKEELKCEVIFTGGPADRSMIDSAIESLGIKTYNLAGKTNLGELAELYKRAELYIGGDTGPMHLAVALSLPVVVIMGPTDPDEFGPYGYDNTVLRDESIDCLACWKRKCPHEHQCMANISVEQVFNESKKYLIERL